MTARSAGARLLAERMAAAHGQARVAPIPAAGRLAAGPAIAAADGEAVSTTPAPLPDYVLHALARWQLLHDVGFRYLVADPRLLPEESIRFFTLDQGWLDALVAGALSAGGQGSRERARAAQILPSALAGAALQVPPVRDIVRGRLVLDTAAPAAASAAPGPGIVTGLLLRSAAVSGWPGLQVRAWTSDRPADVPPGADPAELAATRPDLVVPLLRMELLAPSVLVVLFQGTPALVWLEEPHHGVQLGLEADGTGWSVPVRDSSGHETGTSVGVPMRPGPVAGVVDVAALRAALDTTDPLPAARGSAAIALALLQAPSRQRFAASAQEAGHG